jgi:hypothetical protein
MMRSSVLGLMITALAPAHVARAISVARVSLVKTRIGTADAIRSCRRISHSDTPSMSDKHNSVSTNDVRVLSACTNASRPSIASDTSHPAIVSDTR